MNFLFHMYLSGDDPELLVGNFMGDFVKGMLGDRHPPRVRQGLMLHRKIDSFAHTNQFFQASKTRLDAQFGLYRGVLIDLFYDHFLARQWEARQGTPLTNYLAWARRVIEQHHAVMPEELQPFVPVIFNELLPSYGSTTGIATALQRMSRRIRRPNPLADGGSELGRHYIELQHDFSHFTREVQQFVADFLRQPPDANEARHDT